MTSRAGAAPAASLGRACSTPTIWLDPKRQVTGLIMTQILPFADPIVLQLLTDFETAVYKETASHG